MTITRAGLAKIDPYSFYPSKMHRPKGEIYRASKRLIDISPTRPLVVTDKEGNVMYVTSNGKIMVKVDIYGSKIFSINGMESHKRDSKGNLTEQKERKGGSNIVVIKNEFGEKIGSEKYGLGGKIIAKYDEDDNLITNYEYKEYGKTVDWIIDELTQAKIKYDDKGRPTYEIDYEGNIIATYKYDGKGKLEYKEDVYGNKTFYNERRNEVKTITEEGDLKVVYKYEKDKNGYYCKSIKDMDTGNVILYRDGKQQYEERNAFGDVIKTYKWLGSKLIFSEDLTNNEITWYKNGKPTYTTYNGYMLREWMYYKGELIGIWNDDENKCVLYYHGRQKIGIYLEEKPELSKLLEIYKLYGFEI